MNNLTAPPKEYSLAWLEKLAALPQDELFGACADFEPPLLEKLALMTEPEIIPPPVKDTRLRKPYKFWLNVLRDDHLELSQTMDSLKRQRRFAKTIRDGVRLVVDLRKGEIGVLLELFPFVRDVMAQEIMH